MVTAVSDTTTNQDMPMPWYADLNGVFDDKGILNIRARLNRFERSDLIAFFEKECVADVIESSGSDIELHASIERLFKSNQKIFMKFCIEFSNDLGVLPGELRKSLGCKFSDRNRWFKKGWLKEECERHFVEDGKSSFGRLGNYEQMITLSHDNVIEWWRAERTFKLKNEDLDIVQNKMVSLIDKKLTEWGNISDSKEDALIFELTMWCLWLKQWMKKHGSQNVSERNNKGMNSEEKADVCSSLYEEALEMILQSRCLDCIHKRVSNVAPFLKPSKLCPDHFETFKIKRRESSGSYKTMGFYNENSDEIIACPGCDMRLQYSEKKPDRAEIHIKLNDQCEDSFVLTADFDLVMELLPEDKLSLVHYNRKKRYYPDSWKGLDPILSQQSVVFIPFPLWKVLENVHDIIARLEDYFEQV